MDIFEFVDGIHFCKPTPRKLEGLLDVVKSRKIRGLPAEVAAERKRLEINEQILLGCWQSSLVSFATPAMDDFFMRLHFDLAAEIESFDYVLASICNFAAQQLAMRRLHDNETYLQIGINGWPQFIGALLKNEPLTCNLLLDQDQNLNSFETIIRDRFSQHFHSCHRIQALSVDEFHLPKNTKIGALVLIELDNVERYLESIELLSGRMSPQAELIVQDTKHCLKEVLTKLNINATASYQFSEKDYLNLDRKGNLKEKSVLVVKNFL